MATFPSLTPSARTYTPGDYPHTPFSSYSGLQSRVRHSNVMLASQLRLQFIALTEADMLSILSHYNGQYGTYESFILPSTIWSGVTTASDYQLTGYQWRYTAPPTVDDVYCGKHNIELVLETVPPSSVILGGDEFTVTIGLAAGTAYAASGLTRTVTVSQAPAVGVLTFSGATLSTTLSLGSANGLLQTVTATLAPGTATGGTVAPSDYWADMSVQLYGWEALAYIEWWGN